MSTNEHQLLETLKDLFPSIDIEVIESVIEQCNNDEEAAIELLVQINDDEDDEINHDDENIIPINDDNNYDNDQITTNNNNTSNNTTNTNNIDEYYPSNNDKVQKKPSSSSSSTSTSTKLKLYEIIDEEGILNEIDNIRKQVSNILQLFNNNYQLDNILKYYKWNVENIIIDYGDIGLDGILTKIGLLNNNSTINSTTINSNNSTYCESCYEDSIELIKNPNCGHLLCENCWRNYIESIILQQTSLQNIKCPQYDCNCILSDEFILSFISNDTKYENLFIKSKIESFMRQSILHVKRCLNENCKFAIKKLCDENLYYCKCKCEREYCFHCDQDPHYPATCEMMNRFLIFSKEHSKNLEFIKDTCKQCPKCKVYVHRISGCDRMVCGYCGCAFCYSCGQTHSYQAICTSNYANSYTTINGNPSKYSEFDLYVEESHARFNYKYKLYSEWLKSSNTHTNLIFYNLENSACSEFGYLKNDFKIFYSALNLIIRTRRLLKSLCVYAFVSFGFDKLLMESLLKNIKNLKNLKKKKINNNINMENDLILLKTFGHLFDMNYERLEDFVNQLLAILRNFTQTPLEEEFEEHEKLLNKENYIMKSYNTHYEFGSSLFTQEKHLKFNNLISQIKNLMELILKQTENVIDMIKSMEMKTI